MMKKRNRNSKKVRITYKARRVFVTARSKNLVVSKISLENSHMAEFSELEILRTDGDFFLNEIRKKFALRVLGEPLGAKRFSPTDILSPPYF